MRLKLPDNFGGLSLAGEKVKLKADAEGCVDVDDGEIAVALMEHGAQPVPPKATPTPTPSPTPTPTPTPSPT